MNNGQRDAAYGFLGLNASRVITDPALLGDGIDALQIGNGDVTNTQLSYSNSLTGNIQTQINTLLPKTLAAANIFVGSGLNVATAVTPGGELSMDDTGDFTLSNSAVTGKLLTGLTPSSGTLAGSDTILQGFDKVAYYMSNSVSSFNGRTGPVTSQGGDYSFSQISGVASSSQGGTGLSGATTGDILVYGGVLVGWTTVAAHAVGQVLISNGTNTLPSWSNNASLGSLALYNNVNQLVFGTTNTMTFSMAALSSSYTFTLPAANCNPVQPSSGSTNQFANAISSAGVVSYGYPGILNDVQATVTNSGITTTTDIIVAIAPLMNANGYCLLTITDGANALTIQYRLKLNQYNIGQQPPYLIDNVWDTKGIITKDNLSNYLTFIAYYKSTSPTYIAVTVRMTGGLLYGGTVYKYTCTCFGEFFLSDNTGFTQFLGKNITNLPTATNTYKLNGNTVQYSTFPASSLFLYAVGGGSIQPYTINSSAGTLTTPLSSLPASGAFDVIATPNGQTIFVTNTSGGAQIYGYTTNIATGGLTLGTTNASGATSLQYMAIHPNANFLYLTALAGIYMYSISGTTLTALSPASIANSSCVELTIHPNGNFLYVAGGGNNVVYQFSINTSTGQLTALSPSSVSSNACTQVAVHPNGLYAYATINISGGGTGVNMFSIDSGGHLAALSPATATSGNLPVDIAITPNGLYAYAVNNGDNTISCYSINTSNGQLTNFATVSTGTAPNWVKIASSGEYLYVTNKSSHTVQAYSISATGVLTSLGTISAPTNVNQLLIV